MYVAQKQVPAFRHILSHKKNVFSGTGCQTACVYVGPNHPRYEDESIDFTELPQLNSSADRDFFSMEHHLNHVSLGAISTDMLNTVVHTNSDHMTMKSPDAERYLQSGELIFYMRIINNIQSVI